MGLQGLARLTIPPQAGVSVPLGMQTTQPFQLDESVCCGSSAGEVFRLMEEEGVLLSELEPVPLDGL